MKINKKAVKRRLREFKESRGEGSDTSIVDVALNPDPQALAEQLLEKGKIQQIFRDAVKPK
ncbi:MAG: hypothetical protein COT24_00765 [Candidatus Kerfeldbacteria bacterium CG08_land_8_20_14_0_20_40_16]|uniref:Uncharacterized protein n=1 Tax=Candidatus Kerfeldbacteria bacterium CG08_land_8_20_14_0_20_40_16 TaxID=2014244 RepID=A0A2H0YWU0_9BACT|nr:MAG: hypothetical protein COT24_00765 [Candidatus Kerfeldbacteria bacterium CG08_land_8_20_14_0_20_40_16]